jgi:hypothetical protein
VKVTFLDSGREPKCPSDPTFPNGKEVDLSGGSKITCTTALPYPAPRCGMLIVDCERCGLRVAITTAGRPDDPRSATLACKMPEPVGSA